MGKGEMKEEEEKEYGKEEKMENGGREVGDEVEGGGRGRGVIT